MARNTKKTTPKDRRELDALRGELDNLHHMSVGMLQLKWREVFGESARSRNKQYLIKRIAYRLQEKAEGGLSARAKRRIAELAIDAPIRRRQKPATSTIDAAAPTLAAPAAPRDPRLPPVGTILRKAHGGREHLVHVGAEGFEYRGRPYRSLSAIAKEITGSVWNGWSFFGLKGKERAS